MTLLRHLDQKQTFIEGERRSKEMMEELGIKDKSGLTVGSLLKE